MYKFYPALFFILLTSNYLETKMITIKTINDLMSNIKGSLDDALVVFDVDHTLIKPTGLVGGHAWVTYEKEKRIAQGMNYQETVADLVKILMPIQHKISMIPCEDSTVAILSMIQEKAGHVIAMTGRQSNQADFTIQQLKSLKISFLKTSFKTSLSSNANYDELEGVYFCSGKDKGPILMELLQAINEIPNNIIIIENSLKKLDDMMQVLAIHYPDIKVLGILYEYRNQALFDTVEAERELAAMQNDR